MTSRLWIQCDNTVKELRNQYGCRALSALVQSGTFASSSMAHLRVGHTHEDIDALFSLITTALRTTPANDPNTTGFAEDDQYKAGAHLRGQRTSLGYRTCGHCTLYFSKRSNFITAPCIFPISKIKFEFFLGCCWWLGCQSLEA